MMNALQPLFRFQWREQRDTLNIATSMMLAQLIYALGPFINTWLAAQLGRQPLAAQALVSMLFFTFAAFGWGTLGSVGILSARYYGAREYSNLAQVFHQGLMASILLSIPATIILYLSPQIMLAIGQNPQLVALATPYYHALAFAMLPMLLGVVPMELLVGLGKTKIIFLGSVVEIPFNLSIKYALTLGKWGLPKLGLAGIGWGITIVCWIFLLFYLFFVIFYFREFKLWRLPKQQWMHLKEIFQVGWPIGFTYIIEVGFFSFMVIAMGHFSNDALAAYQIAVQFLNFFEALIFSIGQATISRVGRAIGARNNTLANDASIAGIHVGWWFSLTCAFCLIVFPKVFIGIDLNAHTSSNVLLAHYARYFLMFSAFYIIVDSMRVVVTCILRAYKDTRVGMYTSLLGFWFVGSALALFFAYPLRLGPYGLMLGGLLGSVIALIILQKQYVKKYRHV